MAAKQSPLLLRLMARFGEVEFQEKYIPSDKTSWTYGQWDNGKITINPQPHVVDTVMHELLHDLYPTYSEPTICRLTAKLMHQLTDEQIKAIYEEYQNRLQ